MTPTELVAKVEDAIQAADKGTNLPASVLQIRGHGSTKVSTFLNVLCGSISNCRYLEFGTFTGRSLVAAAYGNLGSFTGVDKLQWLGSSVKFPDVETLKRYLSQNLALLPIPKPEYSVLEMDTKYFHPADQFFDVFFYDADHDYEPTRDGIAKILPRLKPGVLIVDDFISHRKSGPTQQGTAHALTTAPYKSWVLSNKKGWHTGIYVAVIA